MTWKRVGRIGLSDEDQIWKAGMVQQYDAEEDAGAAQEYDVGAPLTRKYPVPVAPTPQFKLPTGLAERLKGVPGEIYDIFPSYPNTTISTTLSASVAGTDSPVHSFTPPTGTYIVLNPGDVTEEALFETFTSVGRASSDYVAGLISIYARTGLQGKQERVYQASSEFHNPFQNMSSVGHRRKWQLGYIVSPGDSMITFFFGATAIGTTYSHLDHRVLAKKITP